MTEIPIFGVYWPMYGPLYLVIVLIGKLLKIFGTIN